MHRRAQQKVGPLLDTSTLRLLLPVLLCRATLPGMIGMVPCLAIVLVGVSSLHSSTYDRRTVPHDRLTQHSEVAGYIYAVIGVIFAVILARW